MTPTLQHSNNEIRKRVVFNFLIGQAIGIAFFALAHSIVFIVINLVMSYIDSMFAKKLIELHYKLEAESVIHIRNFGYDSFRKQIAEIDEDVENEPNRLRRRSGANFAALMRGIGQDIKAEIDAHDENRNR